MADTTPVWAIPYSEGGDAIDTIDETNQAQAERIEELLSPPDLGLLSARPPSTPGTPGIFGRRYYATDTGLEYLDLGTSWLTVNGAISDAQLVSPNNAVHRLLLRGTMNLGAATSYNPAGEDFAFSENGIGTGGFQAQKLGLIWDAADFEVDALTARFTQKAWVKCSGAPGINIDIGLKELVGSPPAPSGSFIGSTYSAVGPGTTDAKVLNVTNTAPTGAAKVLCPVIRMNGGSGSTAQAIWVTYELWLSHT